MMFKKAFKAVEEMGYKPEKKNDQLFGFEFEGYYFGIATMLDDSEYLRVFTSLEFDNKDCNKTDILWKMVKIGRMHPYVKCWSNEGRFILYYNREVLPENNIKECILRSILHIQAAIDDAQDAIDEMEAGYDS